MLVIGLFLHNFTDWGIGEGEDMLELGLVLVVIELLEMEEFGKDDVTADDESEEANVVTGTVELIDVLDAEAVVAGLGFWTGFCWNNWACILHNPFNSDLSSLDKEEATCFDELLDCRLCKSFILFVMDIEDDVDDTVVWRFVSILLFGLFSTESTLCDSFERFSNEFSLLLEFSLITTSSSSNVLVVMEEDADVPGNPVTLPVMVGFTSCSVVSFNKGICKNKEIYWWSKENSKV